ncbi:hypothetical protein D3C87_2161530 [compost metagenome]
MGKGLRRRTASAGISSDGTSPSAENTATVTPPKAGDAPASIIIFGSQVNIE